VNPVSTTGYGYVPDNTTKIYHLVRSGDTPGAIAEKYRVGLSNLKDWNNINRNIIRVGQRLVVYVPKSRAAQYQHAAAGTAKTPKAQETNLSTNQTDQAGSSDFIYYTVRSGDNLWSIAKKFPGVSNTDIMNLNNLSANSKINIGQKLRIKPKS
jgi:membrane-bound lytic murein transglycosylase D